MGKQELKRESVLAGWDLVCESENWDFQTEERFFTFVGMDDGAGFLLAVFLVEFGMTGLE